MKFSELVRLLGENGFRIVDDRLRLFIERGGKAKVHPFIISSRATPFPSPLYEIAPLIIRKVAIRDNQSIAKMVK